MENNVDEDTSEVTCGLCGAVFSPLPGFENYGHQCHTDGTRPEFAEK